MIRAIGNKRLDLSDEEYSYYNTLIETVDKTEFNNVFDSDKNGIINSVMPDTERSISLVVYFFLMNVSFNQRLRKLSSFVDKSKDFDLLLKKVKVLEKEINMLKNKGE